VLPGKVPELQLWLILLARRGTVQSSTVQHSTVHSQPKDARAKAETTVCLA
jgi:hypothetical protein